MKILSFNINGIRAHLHQLNYIIENLNPDFICLQEIKVCNEMFPLEKILHYGYNIYFNGKKKYSGVALLSKNKALNVNYNISKYSSIFEFRLILAEFSISIGKMILINGYFPQGVNKNNIKFQEKKIFFNYLYNYIKKNFNFNYNIIIAGDLNVSHTNLDIGIKLSKYNLWIESGKCSFLPEERSWMNKFYSLKLIDVYRYLNPNKKGKYSWFDYRDYSFKKNLGLRIDYIISSSQLLPYLISSDIDYDVRSMNKPSDHAPIWADFDIKI